MEISGTNINASTFAMKKAMEMENIILNLIQQSVQVGGQSLGTNAQASSQSFDLATITGKGKLIDIVA